MPSLEQSQRKSWASICSCSSCKIEAMTAAGYDDSAPVEDGPEELAEARLGLSQRCDTCYVPSADIAPFQGVDFPKYCSCHVAYAHACTIHYTDCEWAQPESSVRFAGTLLRGGSD